MVTVSKQTAQLWNWNWNWNWKFGRLKCFLECFLEDWNFYGMFVFSYGW